MGASYIKLKKRKQVGVLAFYKGQFIFNVCAFHRRLTYGYSFLSELKPGSGIHFPVPGSYRIMSG